MEEKQEMGQVPAIFQAIAGVIADVGTVSKDKVNKQQGFKYRSIDDVYDALHPALAKNKVFIVPEILEQTREIVGTTKNGARMTQVICRIKFTFYAEDGSHVEAVLIGEGMDTGDKATNKAMAIAYKYACFQVFCIPTEEMQQEPELQKDPDSECPQEALVNPGKNGKAQPKKNEKGQTREREGRPAAAGQQPAPAEKITTDMINTLKSEMDRTGVEEKTICGLFGVKNLAEMDVQQFKKAMRKFEATPDKEAAHE
jgi:hypothetical protein